TVDWAERLEGRSVRLLEVGLSLRSGRNTHTTTACPHGPPQSILSSRHFIWNASSSADTNSIISECGIGTHYPNTFDKFCSTRAHCHGRTWTATRSKS